jgi:hypothetical protein
MILDRHGHGGWSFDWKSIGVGFCSHLPAASVPRYVAGGAGSKTMTFAGLNFLAIVAAAIAGWLASAAWYMSLRRIMLARILLPMTPAQWAAPNRSAAWLPLLYAFGADLIVAWMLAGLLGHLGAGQVTLRNGVISAAFCWFGFVLTTMVVNDTFAGRDRLPLLLDLGHWLIVLILIGAIVGGIGVG